MDFDYSKKQCLMSPPDVRRYKGVAKAANFPEEFELWHSPIKSQENTGSCVAFALASCVEHYHHEETGKQVKMSTGFIYGDRRNSLYKGSGMYLSLALSNLRHYGTTKAKDWDNNEEVPEAIRLFEENFDTYKDKAFKNRITGYYKVGSTNDIKAALYQGCPCVFSLRFRDDMRFENSIWIINEKSAYAGSHCMYIYGWNKDGWKICNSWGKGWGVDGTIIIPFSTKLSEVYGIQDTYDAEKTSEEIEKLEAQLKAIREEYTSIYAHSGIQLTDEEQKRINELEKQIDEIEKKIKSLQQSYIDVKIPFKGWEWLGNIINAIIQFFWRLFNRA